MHFQILFENPIDPELVPELEKGAVYATARLTRFRVTADLRAADVECSESSERARDEVTDKIRKYVTAMTARFRSLGEPEELGRTVRRDERPILSDAFAELERRRWVRPIGRGQVGMAGGAFALKRYLDEAVRNLGRRQFGAQDEEYPALLDPDVLVRCGYFTSFPHSVCLVSHFTEDFDAIEAFRLANTHSDRLRLPDASAMTHTEAALRPAVCLPVYRALENTSLPEGGLTVTTTGKAFPALVHMPLGFDKPLCASLDGFTLHAATRAGALDTIGRETLCKYVLRPAVAQERITRGPDGLVRIALKRAFSDGTVAVDLDPLSLLSRLAASVPPPRLHTVRYAGVLAPASKLRARIVPKPATPPADTDASSAPRPKRGGCRYRPWAELLKRTFGVDVLECPKCKGRMKLLAVVTEAKSIQRMLRHVGEATEPPAREPARGPPYWKSRVLRRSA